MSGPHDLVVLPTLPIAVLPGTILVRYDPMAIGKIINGLAKEG
jgi:hypothetical protein